MNTLSKQDFVKIILQDLNTPNVAPLGALVNAVHFKQELEPHLLASLDQAIEDVKNDKKPSTMSFFAVYLLNEFRSPGLYPLMLKIVRLPEEHLDMLLGDGLTESAGRILAAHYTGSPEDLWEIFDDKSLYEYARYAALHALLVLLLHNKITHESMILMVKERLVSAIALRDVDCATALMEFVMKARMSSLCDVIRQAFSQDLIDLSIYGDLRYFEKMCVRPPDLTYKYHNFIDSAYDELKDWYILKELPPIDLGGRLLVKIGRNDDCFCNSGKKYKKCCLNSSRNIRLPEMLVS